MPSPVPFVDLGRQHEPIVAELRAAFDRVLGASAFTLGREVEGFELEFAAYCGTRHCVGVASGTAAITIALVAAGIGPGDEVIVPAHTFIASALGVVHAGATPVFCDVDDDTGLVDVDAAASALSERTAALLAVHLYGQACDMEAAAAFASRHRLLLVEDAAQAHGATFDGQRAGSLGNVAAFSFYPSKNLGALGDGGAICTDDDGIAAAARQLRHLGQRAKGEHVRIGWNERLDGLQAALLRVKLPHLDAWNAQRRAHAAAYAEALGDGLRLPVETPRTPSVFHLYPVRTPERDAVEERLSDHGVQTGIHYAPALHRQPPFSASYRAEAFPHATAWAAEELSLPMFPGLTGTEIERVAEALAAVPVP
jgi:dTDP-3-amino-3,4,6-trideoxy-alpha-D-glucose transaminase